jgi:hypothetical protein
MAERDGDRHGVCVAARRDRVRIADEFREQIVDVQLVEQQCKECWRPRQRLQLAGHPAEGLKARIVL